MELYFIINNIKYVIKYDEVFKTRIYKKIDNDLVLLTKEELEVLDNIRNIDKSYILKQSIVNIIMNNDNLSISPELLKIIKIIDSIIPEDKKDNFYNNLSTLRITTDELATGTLGEYDPVENIIRVDGNKASYHDLTHELLHLASTSYDSENSIVVSGLDVCSTKGDIVSGTRNNIGLTEGMTEALTQAILPNDTVGQLGNGYYEQAKIANQLVNILGTDKLLEVYFGNNSGFELENALTDLGIDRTQAFILMRNIEESYYNRGLDIEQNLTSTIQNTLLDCLELKINQMRESGSYSDEDIKALLDNYETCMILPESYQARGKNLENYVGLPEALTRFDEIKRGLEIAPQEEVQQEQSMDDYRMTVRDAYLEEKDMNTVISSTFDVEDEKCHHQVTRINNGIKEEVASRDFDYNMDFINGDFSSLVGDYADCGPKLSSSITENENGNCNVTEISENNNVLTVNNVEPQIATTIDNYVSSIQPASFVEQQSLNQQLSSQIEMSGPQLSKSIGSMPGFSTAGILGIIALILCIICVILLIVF